jgi:hypothetical protein
MINISPFLGQENGFVNLTGVEHCTNVLLAGSEQGVLRELKVHHLKSRNELREIYHLRQEIDLDVARRIDTDFFLNERKRDEIGFVFGFELRDQLIGTIRFVPMTHGLTLTERLLDKIGRGSRSPLNWDSGRLVLATGYRYGNDFLAYCLFLALQHLMKHESVEYLFASCSHVLSRLYRRFGFEVIEKNVHLLGINKEYTLICGDAMIVLETLGGKNG